MCVQHATARRLRNNHRDHRRVILLYHILATSLFYVDCVLFALFIGRALNLCCSWMLHVFLASSRFAPAACPFIKLLTPKNVFTRNISRRN